MAADVGDQGAAELRSIWRDIVEGERLSGARRPPIYPGLHR
jgi:hypothetical protein